MTRTQFLASAEYAAMTTEYIRLEGIARSIGQGTFSAAQNGYLAAIRAVGEQGALIQAKLKECSK